MITLKVTTSDGIVRSVDAKKFDKELRVYRIHGDVTNPESLQEMAQILAIEQQVDVVKLNF